MQPNLKPARLNVRHKLVLGYILVTVVVTVIAELVITLTQMELTRRAHIAVAGSIALLASVPLSLWASYRLSHRLDRLLDASRAWLRGNLALRVDDARPDDVGLLSEQLNLLAEQLEEDEQDLDELRERNTRLTDQVRALAVVEERNRLARELHDSVKQHLFSLAMTASALRARFDTLDAIPPDLADMAREIEADAQNAQRETTRLIQDLRPGSLQEQGLAKALNDYTLLFGAQEHLLVYLDVQGDDKLLLPPSATEALYRAAQEALHNVARHARATRVDVHLHVLPERATLLVEDNGIGFDTTSARRGLGMTNMQERVMNIGGRLTVESQVGIGTMVMAEVGLPHPLSPQAAIGPSAQDRPRPTFSNWAWLGQKLVIPVGQTWPWLPADRIHLREPLIEAKGQALRVRRSGGFLGLSRGYSVQFEQQLKPLLRFHHSRAGYEWEMDGASWALRSIRGVSGRTVLTRNQQALAAVQYQGRQMNTWSEIIYDNHGYRLVYVKDKAGTKLPDEAEIQGCGFVLTDEQDDPFCARKGLTHSSSRSTGPCRCLC